MTETGGGTASSISKTTRSRGIQQDLFHRGLQKIGLATPQIAKSDYCLVV